MLHRETISGIDQRQDLLEFSTTTKQIPPVLLRIAVGWCFILAGLFFALISYGSTAGPSDLPPSTTPFHRELNANSVALTSTSDWEVVMAIHPKCPCTVASVNELKRLVHQFRGKINCRFLVFAPADPEQSWMDGPTVSRLAQFPNATIQADAEGKSANNLGMKTSGAVILFDSHGKTRFHGGITVARNHEGDNLGVRSISMLVRGQTPPLTSTPVFGCRL